MFILEISLQQERKNNHFLLFPTFRPFREGNFKDYTFSLVQWHNLSWAFIRAIFLSGEIHIARFNLVPPFILQHRKSHKKNIFSL